MYQTIVFLPLAASIIAGLFGRRIGDSGAQIVTWSVDYLSATFMGGFLSSCAYTG